MKRFLLKISILGGMLVGLPLLGIVLAGYPVERYLEFPPRTRYVDHAPFSLAAFFTYVAFIALFTAPLIVAAVKIGCSGPPAGSRRASFPWWGGVGIGSGILAWILAWTRFPWFAAFQPHTFTPLWLSLILTVNALTFRRSGRCLLTDRTAFFLSLFPFSALFWWFFEYLNRFVQNWYYVGASFSPWEYFWYATLPFSTVLPAVLSVQEWVRGFGWVCRFHGLFPIRVRHPKGLAGAVLVASGLGLAGIGIFPNALFSLLWISPLLIIVSLQTWMGESNVFSDASEGNWDLIVSSAIAALICGLFWETWNFYSLAKWKYTVPLVQRFPLFEMPLLGYAGYLPFGLECMAVGKLISDVVERRDDGMSS
jgi:hypothetical protein